MKVKNRATGQEYAMTAAEAQKIRRSAIAAAYEFPADSLPVPEELLHHEAKNNQNKQTTLNSKPRRKHIKKAN